MTDRPADPTLDGAATNAVLLGDDGAPLPYGEAADELDAILGELDASTVDVDHLAERVRRAADLVRHCRARLDVVRADVAEVVDGLGPSDPADA